MEESTVLSEVPYAIFPIKIRQGNFSCNNFSPKFWRETCYELKIIYFRLKLEG